jgi:hypothetical protein
MPGEAPNPKHQIPKKLQLPIFKRPTFHEPIGRNAETASPQPSPPTKLVLPMEEREKTMAVQVRSARAK